MKVESLRHEFAIDYVARTIKIPFKKWPGKCYEIACAILKTNIIKGKARYGHWLGPVKEKTMFDKKPIIHHGWIECDDLIVDPTRWVFEGVKPYIYVGENDFYDIGGNVYRAESLSSPPSYQDKKEIKIKVNRHMSKMTISENL